MFTDSDLQTPQGRSRKGLASISVANGYLRIRIRIDGKRLVMTLGLADTSLNRKLAEQKCRQINLDIISGNFDVTLSKYKPQTALPVSEPESMPRTMPTPVELWEGYVAYKASSLKETTKLYHESFARLFGQLGNTPLMEALKVKAKLEQITTVHQTKRALMQLSAACQWGVKHGLIDRNPYEGMANEMPRYRYQLEPKPNAFTKEEREQIIQAFKSHQGNWNGRGITGIAYCHYTPFVEFLFLTGCRPSEAVGLQWKNVSQDGSFVHFEGSITTSGRGKPIRVKGSKNNKNRRFPCSERLRSLLQSLRSDPGNPEALVFPAPKGKAINYNNFCNNAWKRIVDPIKPDTTPYSCRDTFITIQILERVPETVIAEWCDTSVEMIQKHYADFLKMFTLRPID